MAGLNAEVREQTEQSAPSNKKSDEGAKDTEFLRGENVKLRQQMATFSELKAENATIKAAASKLANMLEALIHESRWPIIPDRFVPRKIRLWQKRKALRSAGIFDQDWYAKKYLDVSLSGMNPLRHFVKRGLREGRYPNEAMLIANAAVQADLTGPAGAGPSAKSSQRAFDQPKDRLDEYDIIKAAFDSDYYRRQYPDVASSGLDFVKHYIDRGAREGRNPSPDFITRYYVERYPDVLRSGLNPFYHYLTMGRAEGRGPSRFSTGEQDFEAICGLLQRDPHQVGPDLVERRQDLRQRMESGVLGEMIARAGELEPLIHQSWPAAMSVRLPSFHQEGVMAQTTAIHRLQIAANNRRARSVIAIRSSGVSGVSRIAGHLAHALANIYGPEEVLVLRTDVSGPEVTDWFPIRCRNIDFAVEAKKLPAEDQQRLLVEYIRSFRPDSVFNMNSRLLWDSMLPYGKALSRSTAIHGYMFCNDLDLYGHWVGYPNKYFYRYFELLSSVITDSKHLADDLRLRFQLPPQWSKKLVTLDTPVSDILPLQERPERTKNRRPKVFWAGRFDRQKRVDIVAAIAARLPDVDFHLWGEPVLDNSFKKLQLPPNIKTEGVYRNFADLPLSNCDVWLYTSQWDGVPNMLFEVAGTGIPLVGSLAGGCGAVLIDGLCERVADVENVDGFVAAIRRVLSDPTTARQRAAQLRERILKERTAEKYQAAVVELLGRGPSS